MIYTLAFTKDTMSSAMINTIVGMGTVFVALIVISFMIWMLGKICNIQDYFNKRAERIEMKRQKTLDIKQDEIPDDDEEDSNNEYLYSQSYEEDEYDYQLVAVITAAVCAYMGDETPTDGLVVRSIRRVRKTI